MGALIQVLFLRHPLRVTLPGRGDYAGDAPWPISRQRQNTVMVGCAPSGAKMWEALFHVWTTLQSPLG